MIRATRDSDGGAAAPSSARVAMWAPQASTGIGTVVVKLIVNFVELSPT